MKISSKIILQFFLLLLAASTLSSQTWHAEDPNTKPAVKFAAFSLLVKNSNVMLHWNTTLEHNTKDFIIQRSSDSVTWITLGTVNAAGNSDKLINYSFIDGLPARGKNYYRLVNRDINDKAFTGETQAIDIPNDILGYEILSNPVLYTMDIINNSAIPKNMIVCDLKGKTVKTFNLKPGMQLLDFSGIDKGTYITSDGVTSEKIIVR